MIPLFVTNAIDDAGAALRRRPQRARLAARGRPLPGGRPADRAGRQRRGVQRRRRQRHHERRAHPPHPRRARQAAHPDQAGGRSAGSRPPLLPRHREAARPGGRRRCPSTEGLQQTVEWYRDNQWWWRPIKEQDAAFKAYYQTQYGARARVTAAAEPRGPVLVTGAAGFAGSHLPSSCPRGAAVSLVARSRPPTCPPGAMAAHRPAGSRHRARRGGRAAAGRRSITAPACRMSRSRGRPPRTRSRATCSPRTFCSTRCGGWRARALLVTGSATVYAASDQPIAEDARSRPAARTRSASWRRRCWRGARPRGRPGRGGRARVQSHRPASDAGVRGAELRAPDRPDRARRHAPVIRAGNLDAAARPLRRPRRGARVPAADGARRPGGSTTWAPASAARLAILHALVARARVHVTVETDPAQLRPNDTPALVGDSRLMKRDRLGARASVRADARRSARATGGRTLEPLVVSPVVLRLRAGLRNYQPPLPTTN